MEFTNAHIAIFRDIRTAEKRATAMAEKSSVGIDFVRTRNEAFMDVYIERKAEFYGGVMEKYGIDEDCMFAIIEHGVKNNWHLTPKEIG